VTTATAPGPPPAAPRPAARWRAALPLLPPALVLVLGGVLLARGHGLWFDELFTAEVARLPLGEILRAVVEGRGTTSYLRDVPPSYNAPYYVVVHAWLALPWAGGETSLRLLSLLATAAGVAVLGRAVTRLAGPAAGLVAGSAVAANPLLVEQAVEARPYGLAVLATAGAALGLARWLDGARHGLLLVGLAGAGMGLAHWYAVPVLAGLALAGLVLRPRRAGPLLAVSALAALPAAGLVAVNLASGNGARNAEHLRSTGGRLPGLAVQAWAGGQVPLLVLTLALALGALVAVPRLRVVAAAWLAVPLALLTAAELARPVYLPRYLLVTLLGLGVLAGAGAASAGRWRVPLSALLVGSSLLATAPVLDRPPRERADELVAALAARQVPGEPVVAADHRAAIGLDHYVRLRAPRLRADLVFPPDDAPQDRPRVWLARSLRRGALVPSDDDALLAGAGLRVAQTLRFPGTKTTLVVQRWERTAG
jgi:mannosyltransferase